MPYETLSIPVGHEGAMWHYHGSRGPRRRFHRHDELEVNLVLEGSATYLVDDQRYDLGPGTQIWLYPAQDHLLIDESDNYTMWIGLFRQPALRRFCIDPASRALLRRRPQEPICRQLPPAGVTDLHRLFQQITAIRHDPPQFNAGLAYAAFRAWAAHRQADEGPPAENVHPAVDRAARLIRDAHDPLGLQQVAARAGLSPSRLGRLFKQQTGASITRYRQRQQLQRFLDLYGQGQRRTVIEAALSAGFGSYPQFHRVFKQAFGFGPAEYRRRLQRE